MWDRTIAGPPACEEWLGCGESMKVEKAEVIYGPHDRRWTLGSRQAALTYCGPGPCTDDLHVLG